MLSAREFGLKPVVAIRETINSLQSDDVTAIRDSSSLRQAALSKICGFDFEWQNDMLYVKRIFQDKNMTLTVQELLYSECNLRNTSYT